MTTLEKFKLPSDGSGGLDIEDLKILAKAPFLENLTELVFLLNDYEGEAPYVNPEFLEPLTVLLHRCGINLKILKLSGAPSLQKYHDLIPNLERLSLVDCNLPEDVILPRSLEYLKLSGQLGSPTALGALLSSGTLPELKTLEMDLDDRRSYNDVEYINWAQCMQRMNLPSLEILNLPLCAGITSNDVFRIAEAAPNIPNLRNYSVFLMERDTIADPRLTSQFFSNAICHNLEILQLIGVVFDTDGFKHFVDNASNMPCLKTLYISATTERDIQSMAEAGARGAWPQLEVLEIDRSRQPLFNDEQNETRALIRYTDCQNYCRDLLEPIWPTIKLDIL